jgi:hypothetical protein
MIDDTEKNMGKRWRDAVRVCGGHRAPTNVISRMMRWKKIR